MGKQPVEIVFRQSRQQPVLAGNEDSAAFSQRTPPRRGGIGERSAALGPPLVMVRFHYHKKILAVMSETAQTLSFRQRQRDTIVCWQTDGPSHGPSLQDQACLQSANNGAIPRTARTSRLRPGQRS